MFIKKSPADYTIDDQVHSIVGAIRSNRHPEETNGMTNREKAEWYTLIFSEADRKYMIDRIVNLLK